MTSIDSTSSDMSIGEKENVTNRSRLANRNKKNQSKIKRSKGKCRRRRVSSSTSRSIAMASTNEQRVDGAKMSKINEVWSKVKFNGHRTSSLGARAISYDNVLQSFREMVSSNDDHAHMAYEWIMYNVRRIGELLSEKQSSITSSIKTADSSIKSDLRKERQIVQFMRSTIESCKRNQGVQFDYVYPLWLAVTDEMFKFKLVDYSIYDLKERPIDDQSSNSYRISVLFEVIIRSMPIANPCMKYNMSMQELMILLGWLLSYRDDLIDLLDLSLEEMNQLNTSVDGMKRQLIIILDSIFSLCCNCRCYEESEKVIKTGNNDWRRIQ